MKTMFAALASALLVSTAFAQTTAAPAATTNANATASTQAGQADLKAGTAAQNGSLKAGTSATEASTMNEKAATKGHAMKKSSPHAKKTHAHKMSKKKENTAAGADKTTAPAKADIKADTKTDAATKTQ